MSSSARKKERRKMRYLRNVRKEQEYKKAAWESGKIIEENHNGDPYSPEFSVALCDRIRDILKEYRAKCYGEDLEADSKYVLRKFAGLRKRTINSILFYNPGIEKVESYWYLKNCLETYWDNPENLINVL